MQTPESIATEVARRGWNGERGLIRAVGDAIRKDRSHMADLAEQFKPRKKTPAAALAEFAEWLRRCE